MRSLTLRKKAALYLEAWYWYLFVQAFLRIEPLPRLVQRLRASPDRRSDGLTPARLGRIVGRSLRVNGRSARCLISALVLYRLLRERGQDGVLVVGLPDDATGVTAHAWIEVDGIDVGPPPGRGRHLELARYS